MSAINNVSGGLLKAPTPLSTPTTPADANAYLAKLLQQPYDNDREMQTRSRSPTNPPPTNDPTTPSQWIPAQSAVNQRSRSPSNPPQSTNDPPSQWIPIPAQSAVNQIPYYYGPYQSPYGWFRQPPPGCDGTKKAARPDPPTYKTENLQSMAEAVRSGFRTIEALVKTVSLLARSLDKMHKTIDTSFHGALTLLDESLRLIQSLRAGQRPSAIPSILWAIARSLYRFAIGVVQLRLPGSEPDFATSASASSAPSNSWPTYIWTVIVLGGPWIVFRYLRKLLYGGREERIEEKRAEDTPLATAKVHRRMDSASSIDSGSPPTPDGGGSESDSDVGLVLKTSSRDDA